MADLIAVDCTCPSSLTREEAMARLLSVPAMPRGERAAQSGLHPAFVLPIPIRRNIEGGPAYIRRIARPVSRLREERKRLRAALDVACGWITVQSGGDKVANHVRSIAQRALEGRTP